MFDASLQTLLNSLATQSLGVLVTFLLGVPAIAVGLSALSLLASVFSSLKKTEVHSPKSEVRNRFAKDAAAIPNALAATSNEPRAHRKKKFRVQSSKFYLLTTLFEIISTPLFMEMKYVPAGRKFKSSVPSEKLSSENSLSPRML